MRKALQVAETERAKIKASVRELKELGSLKPAKAAGIPLTAEQDKHLKHISLRTGVRDPEDRLFGSCQPV